MPRTAYDKSMSYRKNVENAENELPIRNYMVAYKARDDTKKKYAAHDTTQELVHRKLESNNLMTRDGWDTSKLDNIQNRIHSVLKQVNK
jgi:hypothetical protein